MCDVPQQACQTPPRKPAWGGRDRFIIWGSKGHGLVLHDAIRAFGGEVVALCDNDPRATSICPPLPVLLGLNGLLQWLATVDHRGCLSAAVAIAGSRGRDREMIAGWLFDNGLSVPAIIHSQAIVSPSAVISAGAHVLANAVVAAGSFIGQHTIINNSSNIDHECHIGTAAHVAPGAVLCGCVTLEDYAFIGAGAVVLPRIRIGTGATVGAGATVTQNVAAGDTVVGCPARSIGIKKRDNDRA
jgi:sugar O-acyltransferase (sialic acid O-acetyltransferase NeuD family)